VSKRQSRASRTALLLIDVINDMDFEGSGPLVKQAEPMARRLRALKARARKAGIPAIYINDNFGQWRSDFRTLVDHCLHDDVPGRTVASILQPEPDDYFVLKPKNSAFYDTTLDTLLDDLGTERLILTGIAGNNCILFSAYDAYLRDYELFVPSDCVVSNTKPENSYALRQMKKILKANTTPSAKLRLGSPPLRGRARARRRVSGRRRV
jgi:nicotinamidase-related amidase